MAFRKLFFKRVQGIRDNYLLQEGDIALDESDFKLYRGDGETVGGVVISGAGGGGGGIALSDISVTQASASGAGTLAYNSSTGVFTYTPPTASGLGALTSVAFADVTSKPTTIAGYGITDAFDGAFGSLSGTPTTLAGYGITDAATLNNMAPTGAVDFTGATSVDFTGATITALDSSALTKPIDLDDNEEVRFGTDNDMRIYHSGTTGNIDNNTGTLIISGPTVRIQDGAMANTAISAANGIATLLFENSAKLATSTDGVAVTGKITGLTDPTDAQDAATKAYVDANAGGSGLQSRTTKNGVTGNLIDGNQASVDITGFKGYALLKVYTSRAARVRIYTDDASRTADASRAEGTDPTADAGVVAEVITTTANETVLISPGAFGFNNESTPTTTIPTMITNKSGSTQVITVTLTLLQLES